MTTSGMSPLELVNEFIRRIEMKDIDGACELIAPHCEYDNVPMSKMHGPDAVKAALGPFLAGCTEVSWVVAREASTGPFVFNERLDRFHMAHGWVEIPVTGVWEVLDGHIVLWRDYFDLATFRNQMPTS
jgi:limonene-1,2-epoxide hydrolase